MIKMPLNWESSDELRRLRMANHLAQDVLLKRSSRHESSGISAEDSYHSCEGRLDDLKQLNVHRLDTYHDIWGADKILNREECSISYAKERLRSSAEILQKSNALLRVSKPCSYETVEDTASLTNGQGSHFTGKLVDTPEERKLQPISSSSNSHTVKSKSADISKETKLIDPDISESSEVAVDEGWNATFTESCSPSDLYRETKLDIVEEPKQIAMVSQNETLSDSPQYVFHENLKNENHSFHHDMRLLDVIFKEDSDDSSFVSLENGDQLRKMESDRKVSFEVQTSHQEVIVKEAIEEFSFDSLKSDNQQRKIEFDGKEPFQAEDLTRCKKRRNLEKFPELHSDGDRHNLMLHHEKKENFAIRDMRVSLPPQRITDTSSCEVGQNSSSCTGIETLDQKCKNSLLQTTEELKKPAYKVSLSKTNSFDLVTEATSQGNLYSKHYNSEKRREMEVEDDENLSQNDDSKVVPSINLTELTRRTDCPKERTLPEPRALTTTTSENLHQREKMRDFPLLVKKQEIDSLITHSTVWDLLPNEIILHIFLFLSEQDLKQVSKVCHRFHALAKDHCLWSKVEAADVEITSDWLCSFHKVQRMKLCRCKSKQMNNKMLRMFFQNSRDTLKSVHVSQCGHKCLFGDNILLHIATHCRRVQSINLPWSNTSDNGISALVTSNLILKDLDISGNCFISDTSFIALMEKTGSTLKTLRLNGCFALTNESFVAIANNCPEVHSLDVGLCPKMESYSLILISSTLKCLKELNLRGMKCVDDSSLCSLARNCKHLSKLVLANCQSISDNGISSMAIEIPDLKDLDLSGCTKITDEGCCSMASGLKSPSNLNLSSTAVSQVSILALTENFYDSLKCLRLSFCNNITQDCLKKLVSFSFKLQSLHLHGCKRINVEELMGSSASLKICN